MKDLIFAMGEFSILLRKAVRAEGAFPVPVYVFFLAYSTIAVKEGIPRNFICLR